MLIIVTPKSERDTIRTHGISTILNTIHLQICNNFSFLIHKTIRNSLVFESKGSTHEHAAILMNGYQYILYYQLNITQTQGCHQN